MPRRPRCLPVAETFQRLHPDGGCATGIGFGEARHLGCYDARRDGIDADATRPERGGEVLNQCVDRTLAGGVGRQLADRRPRRKRGEQDQAGTFVKQREQLLNQMVGRADVNREERIDFLARLLLDRSRARDPCICDQDIEPVSGDSFDRRGQLGGTAGRGEVRRDSVGPAARGLVFL